MRHSLRRVLAAIYQPCQQSSGVFCDEASVGYNAYSILHTGKDQFGTPFPLFFQAFGEYKNPVDIYFTVPFIAVFGLSEFSVRFSSVFISLLTIIALFILGTRIHSSSLGLCIATLFAITPWSIHLSRTNMEGLQHFLLFTTISLVALTKNEMHKYRLLVFAVCAAIATYCYFPARIIMPLFVMGICIWKIKNHKTKHLGIAMVLYCLCIIPLGIHMLHGGMSRWNQVSFLKTTTSPVAKFAISYSLHFSPEFLFLKGDIDMPGQFVTRHSIRGLGELFLWQAPLILLGIYWMIKKKHSMLFPTLLLLILYPLPSSITTDIPPQATRSIIGLIPLSIFAGTGLFWGMQWLAKKRTYMQCIGIIFGVLLFTGSLLQYVHAARAYTGYAADFWGWQYGPKDILSYFKLHTHEYDEFYLEGAFNAPEIFIPFYLPEEKQRKHVFIGSMERYNPKKQQLFAVTKETYDALPNTELWSIQNILYYPNAAPAFFLITHR